MAQEVTRWFTGGCYFKTQAEAEAHELHSQMSTQVLIALNLPLMPQPHEVVEAVIRERKRLVEILSQQRIT